MGRSCTKLDVLVLGSGVAGLSAVVRLADVPGMRVGVLTKAELSQSATRWAQGGVAAVLGGDEDSTDLHQADTLAAGAGLCDVDAVRVLVDEGPRRVSELIALGAVFDREADGGLARAREGGHSTARILHAGGAATGAEVERALVDAVRSTAAAVLERWFALDLIIDGDRCVGVVAFDPDGRRQEVRARHVVLATGGAGQLYAVTTNPTEATGDGIAMALRAGVPVADVEFFQFHPTALHHPAMPRPLLSEALRGHGALLRDAEGERFIDELAPRDVVSRAMADRMSVQGVDHLWLDATGLEAFAERFPTLVTSLSGAGLDPSVDWLPIAPAAHYLSGGVVTDLDGASAVAGLWAAGETACTGVHGANRLASNSLLEGMVFGARLAEAIEAGREGPSATGAMRGVLAASRAPAPGDEAPGVKIGCTDLRDLPVPAWHVEPPRGVFERGEDFLAGVVAGARAEDLGTDVRKMREQLQGAMTEGAGVLRSSESLDLVGACVKDVRDRLYDLSPGRDAGELANLVDLARALLRAAAARTETRGAHARRDHPETLPRWRRRLLHLRDGPGARK
ncbi:MAG: L-aspartate oxidase [Acidimicrobiales bacterium]|jgi:L-aspartate oxidase